MSNSNPPSIKSHDYTNGEVTVIWKPHHCIHSTFCWKQLRSVFDPGQKPWIKMDGASTQAIIDQVRKCPSGALSYKMNESTGNAESETLETKIEALPNGPFIVYGTLHITDKSGNETMKNETTVFCRCGNSKNKPYCDGSHESSNFINEDLPRPSLQQKI
jgi:uncharacterized Fe-S cluster protein YjdI/CDGSH-type Zn-finger protein